VRLSKRVPRAHAVLALFLCTALCCSCTGPQQAGHAAQPAQTSPGRPLGLSGCGPPITYDVFQKDAFGVDWSKVDDLIAFNTKGSDGLYHVYTVKPDGSSRQQLGKNSPSFPQRTTGTPVWSPSGRFIAFAAEKSAHPGNSVGAAPGWGSYSDLWVAAADGSRAWKLTDVPADRDHGTIIPEFSPDGRLLEWTERTAAGKVLIPDRFAGYWVIKVADFNVAPDGTPSVSGIRTVSPPGDAFNESGGFSADSSSLVFASNFETHNFWKSQIYRLDLNGGATTRLTKGDSYNEHPRYTPASQVLWMTSADNPARGTDWWTMNADGANPQRLSSFNTDAQISGARGFGTKQVYATVVQTANWSPDGRYFYGDVETNLLNSDSVILRVSLTCQGS
jgi:Tol biopolymer transport system component